MRLPLTALLALMALTGCGALSAVSTASEPLETYTLQPLASPQDPGTGSLHLVVELPTAGGALSTDRILIKPSALQAQYLPGARWSDPTPALIQTLLVASLSNRGGYALVGRDGGGLLPDYTLMTELAAFEAQVTSAGVQVMVTLRLTLIREDDRAIVASRLFATATPVATDATSAVVQGFNRATQQILADAVAWVAVNT